MDFAISSGMSPKAEFAPSDSMPSSVQRIALRKASSWLVRELPELC